MSWLEVVNRVFLQWLFIRLTKFVDINEQTGEQTITGWSIQGWILPTTGWRNNIVYLSKGPKHLML